MDNNINKNTKNSYKNNVLINYYFVVNLSAKL